MWEQSRNITLDHLPKGVATDSGYAKDVAHIKWVETRGAFGCPTAVSVTCSHFNRNCRSRTCDVFRSTDWGRRYLERENLSKKEKEFPLLP